MFVGCGALVLERDGLLPDHENRIGQLLDLRLARDLAAIVLIQRVDLHLPGNVPAMLGRPILEGQLLIGDPRPLFFRTGARGFPVRYGVIDANAGLRSQGAGSGRQDNGPCRLGSAFDENMGRDDAFLARPGCLENQAVRQQPDGGGSSTVNPTRLWSGTLPGTQGLERQRSFFPAPILSAEGTKSNPWGGRRDVRRLPAHPLEQLQGLEFLGVQDLFGQLDGLLVDFRQLDGRVLLLERLDLGFDRRPELVELIQEGVSSPRFPRIPPWRGGAAGNRSR